MAEKNRLVNDNSAAIYAANEDEDRKLVNLAIELAGNHIGVPDFGWSSRPDDGHLWTLVYTNNRDSGLLDQSNASVIDKAMAAFDEESVHSERHGHWACGWIDGYTIRVFDSSWHITPAFKAYADLKFRMDGYPVLDEEDYSNREYDSAIEAIVDNIQVHRMVAFSHTPYVTLLARRVFSWLWDNDQEQLENRDDRGAYPDDESLIAAIVALGYPDPDDDDPDNAPMYPDGYPEDDCAHWNPIMEASEPVQLLLSSLLPIPGNEDSQDDDSDDSEPKHRYHACWIPWTGDPNPTVEPADDLEMARSILAEELSSSVESLYWNNDKTELETVKVDWLDKFGVTLDTFDPDKYIAEHDSFPGFENDYARLGEMWIETCDYDDCEIGDDF